MSPEAKEEVKATEAPEEKEYMPEGDAPFTETTDSATAEAAEKESAEEVTEAEEIAEAIIPGEAEKPEEKLDEVEEILKPETEDEKSNVQKRIDRLTAELKISKEEIAKLQGKTTSAAEKPKYTDEQLANAMIKAVEDGDKVLMRDIISYIKTDVKDDLVKMYTDEKEAVTKQAQAIQREWDDVTNAYDRYADTKVPQIYPNSQKDLNIRDATSLLYQVAMALYWSNDPEKAKYYRSGPGGQKLAVADALTYILRNKAGKGSNSKVKKLEKQLTKERMKKSPVSGGPGGEAKPTGKRLSESERLAEVIDERKKFQEERAS